MHPDKRIDSLLAKQSEELADENKHILSQIILAVEFLAKKMMPSSANISVLLRGMLNILARQFRIKSFTSKIQEKITKP